MNIDKKALKGIVDEIEASRARQRGETEHQREVMKRAKAHQLDAKAIRIVLQRRAMGETRRDEQDYYVQSYELALGGKKEALEALERGASVREAAKAGGISTGAAGNLAKAVQKSTIVDADGGVGAGTLEARQGEKCLSDRDDRTDENSTSTTGEDDGNGDGRHSELRGRAAARAAQCRQAGRADDGDGGPVGAAGREPPAPAEHAECDRGASGRLLAAAGGAAERYQSGDDVAPAPGADAGHAGVAPVPCADDGSGAQPAGCALHAAAGTTVTAALTVEDGAVGSPQGDRVAAEIDLTYPPALAEKRREIDARRAAQ